MSGERLVDTAILMNEKVWARLTYADGSEFCFLTTLSPDILRDEGVTLKEGHLVRLDKKYYWNGRMQYRQFPFDGATISLWTEKSYSDPRSERLHEFL